MTTTELTTQGPAELVADLHDAFAEFLRLYVAEGDASPHTIRSYFTHAKQFAAWCKDQGFDPRTTDEHTVADYRRHLVDRGYTRATIALKLAAVGRLYEALTWRGLRADNPAAGLKAPRDKAAAEDKVKFLPLAALPRLLALCNASTPRGWRDRALVVLLAKKGLRIAEAASLTLDDLDLTAEPPAVHVLGKGSKRRTVYLTASMAAVLAGWIERRATVAGDHRALFVALDHRTHGQPLSDRAARRVIDGLLSQAGYKRAGYSAHSLRHTFATWSVAGGASVPAVSADLGHSNIATTGIYAKVAERIRSNPSAYMEALLDELD